MYGLLLFTKDTFKHGERKLEVLQYLLGKWNFGDRKVKKFILTIILYILPGGLILGIFFALIPNLAASFYADYYSMAFAWTTLMIYWLKYVPQIAFRWGWIEAENTEHGDENTFMGD